MLGSFSALSVSAADARSVDVKKLLAVDLNSIEGAKGMSFLGDEYFMYDTNKDNNGIDGGMIHIDNDKWRETGTFTFESVESDFELTGLKWSYTNLSSSGGNIFFESDDTWFLAKLDKDKNTLTNVGTYDRALFAATLNDGYIFIADTEKSNYTLISPDGKEFADKHFDGGINFPRDPENKTEGKYIFYGSSLTGVSAFDDGYEGNDYEVYGYKADGTRDTIYSVKTAEGLWYNTAYSNAFSWVTQVRPFANANYVYSANEEKVYNLGYGFGVSSYSDSNVKIRFDCIRSKLYDKKVVAYFSQYSGDGELTDSAYALIDIGGGDGDASILSKSYKYMGTENGEIYLVQNSDDKWGYIDSNGNELAFFDDAGDFIGDYAPVVSNGKGYLIDRNMNRVSEDITATGTSTYDNGLYRFTTDSGSLLVTYSNETVSVSEASEPTSSDTSSEPSDTNSTAPSNSNPPSGVAVSVLPIIAAISAVIAIKSNTKL